MKVIVERETGKIFGAHIIGLEASILIREIINSMTSGTGDFSPQHEECIFTLPCQS